MPKNISSQEIMSNTLQRLSRSVLSEFASEIGAELSMAKSYADDKDALAENPLYQQLSALRDVCNNLLAMG